MADVVEVASVKPNILVVDDEPDILEELVDFLSDEGFDVTSARDGAEALGLFRHKPRGYFLAVLSDIRMPVMDGLTLARTLRQEMDLNNIAKILIFTGHGQLDAVRTSLEIGVVSFLDKPLPLATIANAVRSAVASALTVRRQNHELRQRLVDALLGFKRAAVSSRSTVPGLGLARSAEISSSSAPADDVPIAMLRAMVGTFSAPGHENGKAKFVAQVRNLARKRMQMVDNLTKIVENFNDAVQVGSLMDWAEAAADTVGRKLGIHVELTLGQLTRSINVDSRLGPILEAAIGAVARAAQSSTNVRVEGRQIDDIVVFTIRRTDVEGTGLTTSIPVADYKALLTAPIEQLLTSLDSGNPTDDDGVPGLDWQIASYCALQIGGAIKLDARCATESKSCSVVVPILGQI